MTNLQKRHYMLVDETKNGLLILRRQFKQKNDRSNQRGNLQFSTVFYPTRINLISWWFFSTQVRGGSRIFSRRGRISKNFSKNLSTFFRSTKLIFRALPEHYKNPILKQKYAQIWQIFENKNQVKSQFLGTFWKIQLPPPPPPKSAPDLGYLGKQLVHRGAGPLPGNLFWISSPDETFELDRFAFQTNVAPRIHS